MIDPDGRQRVFRTPWAPVAWSPDGRRILALRGHTLGVMSPKTGAVRVIARAGGGTIADAAWLE